jgi:16S rRNA (uracil1498-N3)-methyltransferase
MTSDFTKLPRIYIDHDFTANASLVLEEAQSHYLKNVLRRKPGDFFRTFNGRDGEWLASINQINKSGIVAALKEKLRAQPPKSQKIHLLFAPIKKDRMDFIIEKAVELGVTDLHPVLTARTEIRKISEDRIRAQIIEAAEQCERLEVPVLHPLSDLKSKILNWKSGIPLYWCRERGESPHISEFTEQNWAFLIGPVGGFDDAEFSFLESVPGVKPLTLGETVLRAETAVALVLSYAKIAARR